MIVVFGLAIFTGCHELSKKEPVFKGETAHWKIKLVARNDDAKYQTITTSFTYKRDKTQLKHYQSLTFSVDIGSITSSKTANLSHLKNWLRSIL